MELLRCSAGFFFGKTMGCVLVSILTFSLSLSFSLLLVALHNETEQKLDVGNQELGKENKSDRLRRIARAGVRVLLLLLLGLKLEGVRPGIKTTHLQSGFLVGLLSKRQPSSSLLPRLSPSTAFFTPYSSSIGAQPRQLAGFEAI